MEAIKRPHASQGPPKRVPPTGRDLRFQDQATPLPAGKKNDEALPKLTTSKIRGP